MTLRLVIAAVLLGVMARPRLRTIRRADLGVAVAFGLVLAGMNLSFYEAIARIPLGVAVTIEFSGPLALALIGSRRWLDLLWAALAGTGVALFTSGGGRLDPVGILLAFLAGAGWIGYILLNKETGRRFDTRTGLSIAMAAGALAILPVGLAVGGSDPFSPGGAAGRRGGRRPLVRAALQPGGGGAAPGHASGLRCAVEHGPGGGGRGRRRRARPAPDRSGGGGAAAGERRPTSGTPSPADPGSSRPPPEPDPDGDRCRPPGEPPRRPPPSGDRYVRTPGSGWRRRRRPPR